MDVAVTGKGGAGKTALAAMLVRACAEQGRRVLAADLDSNPGLALSLGCDVATAGLPSEAVVEEPGRPYGWGLADGLTPEEVVARFATPVRDGVSLLSVGTIDRAAHHLHHTIGAVREVVASFRAAGWTTVADLEAGPATPFEGFTRPATLALVVAEPTRASLASAGRILSILDDDGTASAVVVNRARPGDADEVAHELGRDVLAEIPADPAVAAAERSGSLWVLEDTSPAFRAVRGLAEIVIEQTADMAPGRRPDAIVGPPVKETS